MIRLRSFLSRRNRENGSAVFVWIVVLFPVFFSLFAAAVDVAIAEYTRTSLQASLDSAAQSALSSATNDGATTSPLLTKTQAQVNFVQYMGMNLDGSSLPWLKCAGGSSAGDCGFDVTSFTPVTNAAGQVTAIRASIHEASTPLFLNAFHILPNGWQYNLSTVATQTGSCYAGPCS